jgi:predicted DNA-binding antitoxin AbrB/MazE fold protein
MNFKVKTNHDKDLSGIEGETEMGKTIKARFFKGKIEPLEQVDIADGKEITIIIMDIPSTRKKNAFEKSAGAWKGTIDAKKLIENIYDDRLVHSRVEPRL